MASSHDARVAIRSFVDLDKHVKKRDTSTTVTNDELTPTGCHTTVIMGVLKRKETTIQSGGDIDQIQHVGNGFLDDARCVRPNKGP